MAVANEQVYPLATQQGNAIPFDIAEVLGSIEEAVVTAATPLLVLPSTAEILVCIANEDTWLNFGATVPTVTQGVYHADLVFIPQYAIVSLKVPTDKASISVKKAGADDGTIRIQVIRPWKALKQQTYSQ